MGSGARTKLCILHWMLSTCSALGAEPASASITPHAQQLLSMMRSVCVSESTIARVGDPGTRTLLEGVKAAADEPRVLAAFTVLYEDIAPVRLAGDFIFRSLEVRTGLMMGKLVRRHFHECSVTWQMLSHVAR